MPSRMQITIDPEMARRVRERAEARGISFAEYVRRLVARDLGALEPTSDPTAVFDLVSAGEPTDVARDKDQLIGEAVAAEHDRSKEG